MRTTSPAGWRRALAVVAIAIGLAGCASEGRFPNGPILLVCPWAAGGGSDRVARQLATLLEQDLGVPVNVVNVTGGDGVTGHSRGALARADGYTMTLVTIEITTLHWRQMTSISPRDFAPIALVNRDPAAIFVRSDAPWRTARDLEQAIRAAPGTLRASGTATSGIWHLALAGWLTTVGLRPTDVDLGLDRRRGPLTRRAARGRHRRGRVQPRRGAGAPRIGTHSQSWRHVDRACATVSLGPHVRRAGRRLHAGDDCAASRCRATFPRSRPRHRRRRSPRGHERGVSRQPVGRRVHARV